MNDNVEYRCPYCDSTELLQDAYVALNNENDVRVFDCVDCDACGEKDVTPTIVDLTIMEVL